MLETGQRGPVLSLILNRPDVRNAFNTELIAALRQAFDAVDASVRVVVLSGAGPVFCAGGDLQWMRQAAIQSREDNIADAMGLAALFHAIAHCPAAVIAKAHKAVFGGGCGLVAAADIAMVREDTLFSFSEVRLGLIPATISPVVLSKIGPGQARALFVSGEVFDAQTALRIGLVHRVVSAEDLEAEVDAKVRTLLGAAPGAVAAAKQLVHDSPLPMEETAARLAERRASPEGQEGMQAFFEKRAPKWVVEP